MKIRLVQPGWENLTGLFGHIEFKDGVSVDDVARIEAQRLANIVQIEEVDTGKNPSVSQVVLDSRCLSADEPAPAAPDAPPAPPAKVWTNDELAAVADEKGIKGLREIAEPLGLKANSIAELIGKILGAMPKQKAADADPAGEPAADQERVNADAEVGGDQTPADKPAE